MLLGMSINCLARDGWMLLGYKATDYSRWGQLQLVRHKSKRLFFKNDPYIIKKDKGKKKKKIQSNIRWKEIQMEYLRRNTAT